MLDSKFAVHLVYLAKAVDLVHKIGVSAEVILFYWYGFGSGTSLLINYLMKLTPAGHVVHETQFVLKVVVYLFIVTGSDGQ